MGASIGDFTLGGQIQLHYPVLGTDAAIGAYGRMSALDAPFFYASQHNTFAWWDKDFKKEFRTHFGGFIDIEKTRTRFQLDVENVANYVYLKNDGGVYVNEDGIPQPSYLINAYQHSGSIQVLSASLQQNFRCTGTTISHTSCPETRRSFRCPT